MVHAGAFAVSHLVAKFDLFRALLIEELPVEDVRIFAPLPLPLRLALRLPGGHRSWTSVPSSRFLNVNVCT